MTQPNALFASSHRHLVERYLSTCVISSAGRPVFAKLEPLRDVDLLSDVAGALAAEVDPQKTDAVCLLANSGLPFGVFLARKLHKPLYCYHSNGWQEKNRVYPVLPPLSSGSRVILADSHVREGFTASKAEEKLDKLGVGVQAIVVPFDFDELHRYAVQAPILSLGRLSGHKDDLEAIFQDKGFRDPIDDYLRDPTFWDYAPVESVDVGVVSSKPDGRRSFLARPRLRRSGVSYVSSRLRTRVKRLLSTSPHGVWHVFTDPSTISNAATAVEHPLGLEEYDLLLGTRPLGTALALSLAYQSSYRGEVAMLIPDFGFVPEASRWAGKRVLLCQETLVSATFPLEVVNAVRQYEAQADTLLTIQAVTRRSKWLPFLRSSAPSELGEAGVRVFALC